MYARLCGQRDADVRRESGLLDGAGGGGAPRAGPAAAAADLPAERYIRDLARTPGAMLVRVSWHTTLRGGVAAEGVKVRTSSQVYAAENLPARLATPPAEADEVSVTLTGAIKPSRPVHTTDDLRAELDATRRRMGLEPLPDAPRVTEVGADDVGFLTYELRFASPVSPGT